MPEADRHAFVAEVGDFLLLAVLEDREVFLVKPGHEPAVAVGHRGGDVDQFDAAAEAERLLRPGAGRCGRNDQEQRDREGTCSHGPLQ